MHRGVLVGQVEGVRVPVEDALHRHLREHAVGELGRGLRLLRPADGVEVLTEAARAETDARERLLDLARADAAAARREIGRLAGLSRLVAAIAGPCAERRIVDVVGRPEVAVENQVMALRILSQVLGGEAEHGAAGILELLGHLCADVVVRREADLVLAVRLEVPRRHDELEAGRRRRADRAA